MASGEILDSQITASSRYTNYKASYARLNMTNDNGMIAGGWIKARSDENSWLKVDFLQITTVNEISTQGRVLQDRWVTSYNISYGNDGVNFQFHEENGQTKVS